MSGNRAAALDAALFYQQEVPTKDSPGRDRLEPGRHGAPIPLKPPVSRRPPSFWQRVRGRVAGQIGMDVGSHNTVIYIEGEGAVLSEPSVVAVKDGKIIAAGKEAREMVGRAPKGVEIVFPLRQGVISDFDLAREMIKIFLRRSRPFAFSGGHIAVAVPAGVTDVDRRALDEAIVQAGASKVTLIDESLAAAIGSGCDVAAPCGRFVASLGAGTTQAAVISLGAVVHAEISDIAGSSVDRAIAKFLEEEYRFLIGDQTAEEIKIALASAMPDSEERKLIVHGRGITGPPRSLVVTSIAVSAAIAPVIAEIVATILRALESAPPELAGDIIRSGIVLTGGGAQIRGMVNRVNRDTGIDVRVADDPLHAVASGAQKFVTRFKDNASAN